MFGHNMFCPDIFCLNFCSDIFCLNLCCQDIFCHDMFCSKYFLQVDEAIRHFYEVSKGDYRLTEGSRYHAQTHKTKMLIFNTNLM